MVLNMVLLWLILGLFKVIFFPNGESTIWGIYSEYVLFFGEPFKQIQVMYYYDLWFLQYGTIMTWVN